MTKKRTLAVDFDGTLFDNATQQFMPGARDMVAKLRSRGWFVLVHSCNKPSWIRQCLREHGVVVDGVWGESPADCNHKPVADVYLDDCGMKFVAWDEALLKELS